MGDIIYSEPNIVKNPATPSLGRPNSSTVANKTTSPNKRARSPANELSLAGADFGQSPSKTASSPSTRETAPFFSTTALAASDILGSANGSSAPAIQQQKSGPSGAGTIVGNAVLDQPYLAGESYTASIQAGNRLQQSTMETAGAYTMVHSASGQPVQPIPSSTSASALTGAVEKPLASNEQVTMSPSSSTHYYKAPSHSGSTTSGFSGGGSTGSSYDGSLDGSIAQLSAQSIGFVKPAAGHASATGLGMVVQGPGYASTFGYPPIASTSQNVVQSPTYYHNAVSNSAPYGYAPANVVTSPHANPPLATSSQYTSVPQQLHQAVAYPSPIPQNYASPGQPMQQAPLMQAGSRRSIAGQSSAGSSFHSNPSMSPSTHRRSDDMDSTIIASQFAPIADVGGSPAVGKQPQQQPTQWASPSTTSSSRPQTGVSSGHPTAYAGQDTGLVQSYYSSPSTVNTYRTIVDEIMSQSRKGSDYGLELGDFEPLDTLGTGTFGRVLLVRLAPRPNAQGRVPQFQPGMPHYFAMKVLTKSEVVRLKQVEHINCERSILGAVEHPGIVNLFCTFQDSLNIYMLLEFVQGGELFSHLRRAVRFSADVSRFYAANIVLVLEYLHNRNLIYRDLKPENLLLDHLGYLKVTDFGFAKYVPDRTFTLCGTPEYLAPEIINSAGHGKAADWWAFGVLLFEMLCGYPPFFDESPWGIYEKILAGTFTFPPLVDPVARDLIRRLLSSDRSKRLGNLRGGALDIKNHQWFEGVDWQAVERRVIPAPIIPRIKSHSDSQNFERYPTVPIEHLPGLAKAKGYQVEEQKDPYENLFLNF